MEAPGSPVTPADSSPRPPDLPQVPGTAPAQASSALDFDTQQAELPSIKLPPAPLRPGWLGGKPPPEHQTPVGQRTLWQAVLQQQSSAGPVTPTLPTPSTDATEPATPGALDWFY